MDETWREFTQQSTFHGIGRAFNTELRLWRRITWMVLVTAAVVGLLYTLSTGVTKLLNPRYGTQISVERSPTIPFPSVTLCPKNMFRKSYVESHPEVLAYIMAMNADIADALTDNDTLRDLALNISLPEVGSKRLAQLLKEAAQPANETIYSWTSFNGELIDRKWFVPEITSMGTCYRFHGDWTSWYPRQGNGLSIWSYVDYDEYFYSGMDLGAMGVKLLPHTPDEKPSIEARGLAAGPGVDTVIGLKKVITTLLPKHNGCVEMYGNYSRGACFRKCEVIREVENCGCKYFYEQGDYPLCLTVGEFECLKQTERNASGAAGCSCPPQCVEEMYDTKVSWLPFPSPYHKKLVPRILNHTDKTIEWDKIARITLYFETFDVTLISETQLYAAEDFYSDVGGLMGLTLGASLLTWVDLLEVLLDMCTNTRRRKQTQPDQQTKEIPYFQDRLTLNGVVTHI